MALGYSVVNGTDVFPGIRYTGRLAGDPLGQMTLGEGDDHQRHGRADDDELPLGRLHVDERRPGRRLHVLVRQRVLHRSRPGLEPRGLADPDRELQAAGLLVAERAMWGRLRAPPPLLPRRDPMPVGATVGRQMWIRTTIALLVVGAAFGGAATAAPSTTRTGLYGVVMRGPIRPTCIEDQPCDAPARGVLLTFSHNGRFVARVGHRAGRHVPRPPRTRPLPGEGDAGPTCRYRAQPALVGVPTRFRHVDYHIEHRHPVGA